MQFDDPKKRVKADKRKVYVYIFPVSVSLSFIPFTNPFALTGNVHVYVFLYSCIYIQILPLQPSDKLVPLFAHLPQYVSGTSLKLNVGFSSTATVHPAIIELGLKYAQGTITGSNARCVAMLNTFKKVINHPDQSKTNIHL